MAASQAVLIGMAVLAASAEVKLSRTQIEPLSITTTIFRAWWFEPAVATLGFASSIAFFDGHERREGYGPRDTFGIAPLVMVAYWLFVWTWMALVPPPSGEIPDGWPTRSASAFAYLALEVAYGIWAYDLIIFWIHWGMHAGQMETHAFHHSKHRHRSPQHGGPRRGQHDAAVGCAADWQLRARDVLAHASLDGALQVVANIAVQRTLPWGANKSRLARSLHNLLVTWMLTEAHTAAREPRLFRRFCSGVREHRQHHEGGRDAYQQVFGYLDHARAVLLARRGG